MRSSTQSSSSDDSSLSAIDVRPDEEWQDAEPDEEVLEILGLFDNAVFTNAEAMLEHCKTSFDFDFVGVVRDLGLEFYDCVKLVNYIRSEVRNGTTTPDFTNKSLFASDTYLKPVLEDDMFLFCLDDIIGPLLRKRVEIAETEDATGACQADKAWRRAAELEEQLQQLQLQFDEYKIAVGEALDEKWNVCADKASTKKEEGENEDDAYYFNSYAYHDIHEIMLKDKIRTSTYRDFIYSYKNLFKDRIVLDVGCGTGILSLFAAKAEARKVIAVDNSNIILKACEIVHQNNLSNVITCIQGKIEEVKLPLNSGEKVDVIVSEWMGYCLLYEAMLDSVIWARDEYLKPDTGLMVPSHCTLRIAPVADPDLIAETVGYWSEVYGFDMRAMTEKIYDDVLIRSVEQEHLAADSHMVKQLSLATVTKQDLTFVSDFEVILGKDVDSLDAWVIWFDTFFLPQRDTVLSGDARAEGWGTGLGLKEKGAAFTTGPGGPDTHWKAGLLVLDRSRKKGMALKEGQVIKGTLGYRKSKLNSRDLEIEVTWLARGTEETSRQIWVLR